MAPECKVLRLVRSANGNMSNGGCGCRRRALRSSRASACFVIFRSGLRYEFKDFFRFLVSYVDGESDKNVNSENLGYIFRTCLEK